MVFTSTVATQQRLPMSTGLLPHMSRALGGLVKNFKVTLVYLAKHASVPNGREASAVMKGRALVPDTVQDGDSLGVGLSSGAEASRPAVSEG